MESIKLQFKACDQAKGTARSTLVGVVASGNLEILMERNLADDECHVEIATPVRGFDDIWKAVINDFIQGSSAGGLRISINDSGARPDTVALRLKQGLRTLESSNG